jgi:hypothetical protein
VLCKLEAWSSSRNGKAVKRLKLQGGAMNYLDERQTLAADSCLSVAVFCFHHREVSSSHQWDEVEKGGG